jgi:hypothetical protein
VGWRVRGLPVLVAASAEFALYFKFKWLVKKICGEAGTYLPQSLWFQWKILICWWVEDEMPVMNG